MLHNNCKKYCAFLIVGVCFLSAVCPRGADAIWLEQDKLIASDGTPEDAFGMSTSISGDYAVAGAPLDNAKGYRSGSAYVFERSGSDWLQQVKLTASDGTAWDQFGESVSMSGDCAVVGAWGHSGQVGSAYIFERSGTDWIQQARLTASDGAAGDQFGMSVSIKGDCAIVGAHADEQYTGSAYIFRRDDPNWIQQQKLTASDGRPSDDFGISVAINGDYAVVGAFRGDGNEVDCGSAYIFKSGGPNDPNWVEQAKLTASDGAAQDYFGVSVAISADYAVVGAFWDDDLGENSGSAYVFKRQGTSWVQQQKLTAADGAEWQEFGYSVSISGKYALVGAKGGDGNEVWSGAVYVFRRSGNTWIQKAKLTASDGSLGDEFGVSVSYDGDSAVVGAWGDNPNGSYSGSAYVFEQVLCPTADLDGDCEVDFSDFAILGNQWMKPPGNPSADIAPEGGDGKVDFLDLAVMTGQWLQAECPTADLSGDCCVDFADFAVISNQWLQAPGEPSADIAPLDGDGVVNLLDLDMLAGEWLQCGE